MTWHWHTYSEDVARASACSAETLLGATGREESRPSRQECLRHIVHCALCLSLVTQLLPASQLRGQVELTNSKDPAVRRNRDYAGVVIWLEPVGRAAPIPPPRHAEMKQQDKTFKPHVLAIPLGGTVDFPNLDPFFHNAFSNFSGQPFDIPLYAPGATRSVTFRRPGLVRARRQPPLGGGVRRGL